MISIREARRIVLERAGGAGPGEVVGVTAAVGHVLRLPVSADSDLPPFDRVMMDGYAVRADDTGAGARLRVAGEVAAGDSGERALRPGEALLIMTGAPLPPGADSVVPVEWTARDGDLVALERGVTRGAHVAPRGEDLRAGAVAARAGEKVTPLSLSLLIATGAATVEVVARPRVAVLTSGNELVPPGAPIRRGQIRESNGPALSSLFSAAGAAVSDLGVARDTAEALQERLAAAEGADIVVLTGGSSVGKYDLSAQVVEQLGGRRHFDRIAVKPGKPTLFYTRGSQLVFCLPGNPVAALMTGRVLVCAAIAARRGEQPPEWVDERRELASAVRRNAQRDQLLPMRETAQGLLFGGWHGSGDLACMAGADGFAFVARGEGQAATGEAADWFPMPDQVRW
jgi:molybdopterin molybdotransferase